MLGLSKIISLAFHPIVLNLILVLFTISIDRYAFYIEASRSFEVFLIMSLFILLMFPMVGILVFKGIGVIPSWEMPDRKDRIAALITTLIFYIWYYINVKNNASIPDTLVFIALGSCIALGLAFFINNFSKISLHTVGAGAFLMGCILLVFHTNTSYCKVSLPLLPDFNLSTIFVLFFAVLVAGTIGTARLILERHKWDDICGGYLVGIIAQLVAYNFTI